MVNQIEKKPCCAICLEDCDRNRPLADTDHKVHDFCVGCLQQWAAQNNARDLENRSVSCPLCRDPIRSLNGRAIIPEQAPLQAPVVAPRAPVAFDQAQHDGAAVWAVRNAQLVRLRELLERHDLSNRARHMALIEAASLHVNNRIDFVKAILDDGPISNPCRLDAIRLARLRNDQPVIDELRRGAGFFVRALSYLN